MGDPVGSLCERIDALQTVGTQPAIAIRLNELGKNRDAELEDYVEVAAKRLTAVVGESTVDEAFAIGLLQDMGLGLLVSIDGDQYAQRLRDPGFSVTDQLAYESERFGMDRSELRLRIARGLRSAHRRTSRW